jgi:hypothetical protein
MSLPLGDTGTYEGPQLVPQVGQRDVGLAFAQDKDSTRHLAPSLVRYGHDGDLGEA